MSDGEETNRQRQKVESKAIKPFAKPNEMKFQHQQYMIHNAMYTYNTLETNVSHISYMQP
jgi:hypothetical protein